MLYNNDEISVADFSGRCKGRLNFSILISWIPTYDCQFRIGDEFKLPFDYFRKFKANSEFNYHDTCDPTSIYRFRLLRFDDDGCAILRIQTIFAEQGDEWLYCNEIKYGTDYGIIEFVGIHLKPDLRLIMS